MTPFWSDDVAAVYLGDALEVVAQLAGPVHAVVTDPPYNLRGGEDIALAGRAPMRRDFGDWDEAWEPGPMLAAVGRLVVPGGSVLCFTSDRLVSAFREHQGWLPRGLVVWEKMNPPPHPRPAYVSATEFVVWLQREGAGATWNAGGYVPNLLRYPVCGGAERGPHPTQKPEALMIDLIERHTNPGDVVLDPYMGSGTTLVAAKRLGRRAVGVERDERWCRDAVARLRQGVLPLGREEERRAQGGLF